MQSETVCSFRNWFKLVTQILSIDQQKAAWFETDFCVSCASYIYTLLTIENGTFFAMWNLANLTEP